MTGKLPAQSSGSSAESPSSAEPPISGAAATPSARDFLAGAEARALRDRFAAQAMAALVASTMNKGFDIEANGGQPHNESFRRGVAREAYAIADAMLAERGRC